MKKRVVITGLGAVTAIGNDVPTSWSNAKKGVCGIDVIKQMDISEYRATLGAEVKDLKAGDILGVKQVKRLDRNVQFALIAAREAIADSGIDIKDHDPYRAAVIVSSGIGGLKTIEENYEIGKAKTFNRLSAFFIPMIISNMAAANIAIEQGWKGSCYSLATACASSTNAIGEAFRSIRDGYNDMAIVGGTEASITQLGMGGFISMRALSFSADPERASIPFDKERDGFVMGEGAGILILEEYEQAKARNAKIYAEVIGYGSTCDAFHITAPADDGSGAITCMQMALQDAEISPEAIGYINAHGTSTPLNDAIETGAVRTVFGDHADKLKMSSTKSMTGHALGAAGAIEGLLTALAIYDNFLPPTINYRVFDEECDLNIIPNQGSAEAVDYALSNSLGFGGHNATVIFKRV